MNTSARRSTSCALAQALENVAVVVEDENIEDPDLSASTRAIPLTERSSWDAGTLPDRITIYRRPLQEEFPDRRSSRRDRITVLHELAHFFGIDEDRLDELGVRVNRALTDGQGISVTGARSHRYMHAHWTRSTLRSSS